MPVKRKTPSAITAARFLRAGKTESGGQHHCIHELYKSSFLTDVNLNFNVVAEASRSTPTGT